MASFWLKKLRVWKTDFWKTWMSMLAFLAGAGIFLKKLEMVEFCFPGISITIFAIKFYYFTTNFDYHY